MTHKLPDIALSATTLVIVEDFLSGPRKSSTSRLVHEPYQVQVGLESGRPEASRSQRLRDERARVLG
jgi:hypothetical protein